MELRIKKTHPNAIIPRRAKPGDSGLDLYAMIPEGSVYIEAGGRERINTGIAIELPGSKLVTLLDSDWGAIPVTFEAQVRPRSGLAHERGIMAALGTIDNGYRGEIWVNLFNHSFRAHTVRHGERIAQLVICPVVLPAVVEVEELSETERGADGFGSTGV